MEQLRRELKAWERAFQDKKGHRPTKTDIKSQPEIAKKFQLYRRLKHEEEQRENHPPSRLSVIAMDSPNQGFCETTHSIWKPPTGGTRLLRQNSARSFSSNSNSEQVRRRRTQKAEEIAGSPLAPTLEPLSLVAISSPDLQQAEEQSKEQGKPICIDAIFDVVTATTTKRVATSKRRAARSLKSFISPPFAPNSALSSSSSYISADWSSNVSSFDASSAAAAADASFCSSSSSSCSSSSSHKRKRAIEEEQTGGEEQRNTETKDSKQMAATPPRASPLLKRQRPNGTSPMVSSRLTSLLREEEEMVQEEAKESEDDKPLYRRKTRRNKRTAISYRKWKRKRHVLSHRKSSRQKQKAKQEHDKIATKNEEEEDVDEAEWMELASAAIAENAFRGANSTAPEAEQNSTSSRIGTNPSSRDIEACLSTDSLRALLRSHFGFTSFRHGQEEAIRRCVKGFSTLVVTPTGSGKSLIFQCAAILFKQIYGPSLVLVIVPLLSLIQDLLKNLPPSLRGGTLNSQQSEEQKTEVMKMLRAGEIDVLFISPERLLSSSFINACPYFPPIRLAAIDESHCVTEISHNFRPSYLRLKPVLRNLLNVPSILALTATANKSTQEAILKALAIPNNSNDGHSTGLILAPSPLCNNLRCTASKDIERLSTLVSLLQSPRFSSATSIIVYCPTQKQTDQVATYLSSHGLIAASYHAGKSTAERSRLQSRFLNNKLKIMVATVAFGMGINKPDVDAVIHFGLPASLEHYIQEIGRAGRDGRQAECHVFFGAEDYARLCSLSHTDSVDESTVKALLKRLFGTEGPSISGKLLAVGMEDCATQLDIKAEVIGTLLAHVETEGYLQMLPAGNAICNLSFYKREPKELAKHNRLIAAILQDNNTKHKGGSYRVDLASVLNSSQELVEAGIDISMVFQELWRLHMEKEITYTLEDKSFFVRILDVPMDIDALSQRCFEKTERLEQCKLRKLSSIYKVMESVAFSSFESAASLSEEVTSKSGLLHELISEYFTSLQTNGAETEEAEVVGSEKQMPLLRSDIKVFLRSHDGQVKTGRQVAKVFHGLASPQLPQSEWEQNYFWGKYRDVSFNHIRKMANEELVSRRQSARLTEHY